MKKLYPSGRAMPTRTGPSEPKQSSHDTSHERMTTSLRSLLRAKSISPFHSHRRRAMVSTRATSGSKLYEVLQRRGWLAIFSPRAVGNRTQVYTKAAQQSTSTTRTSTKIVALQDLEKNQVDPQSVVSNRACEPSEGNILGNSSQRDTNTSATRTPANNAALKALAIAKPAPICRRGGPTVVPNRACELSEGNILSSRSQRDTDTSATRTPANKAALKALAIAKGGITVVPKIFSGEFFGSFFGVKKERPVAASDGKVAGRVNKTLSTSMDHTSSSSHILLLSTIFILLNFCFISATHAQSQTHESGGGAAEVVKGLMVGQKVPEEFWTKEHLFFHNGDTLRQTLEEHRGKIVVLDFWYTGCSKCLIHQKDINYFKEKYPENLVVIMVNSKRTKDTFDKLQRFMDGEFFRRLQLTNFASIIEDEYLDQMFSPFGYPSYFWINSENILQLLTFRNLLDKSYVAPFIDERL